jgi:hypothetical protein
MRRISGAGLNAPEGHVDSLPALQELGSSQLAQYGHPPSHRELVVAAHRKNSIMYHNPTATSTLRVEFNRMGSSNAETSQGLPVFFDEDAGTAPSIGARESQLAAHRLPSGDATV